MAILIGAAGALPHLFFASDIGEPFFFENAWDESFYMLVVSGKITDWNSYPLRSLSHFLLSTTNVHRFAMFSDIAWPALATLAAGSLALTITRGWVAVIPVTFFIIFASDILAFNSSIVFPAFLTISKSLNTLSLDTRKLFSDAFVPFLYIYRTPEPQLSLPVFFCYFGLIIRFLHLPELRPADWLLIFCAGLASTQIYPFLALASLMLSGMGGLSLLLARRWNAGLGLLAITVACGVCLGWLLLGSHANEANATIFASSLPMLAPSLVYSVLCMPLFAWTLRSRVRHNPQIIFGLLCYSVPLVTLNQQIFQGNRVKRLVTNA